jgi:O-antigen/teichoic acid export membrane protein
MTATAPWLKTQLQVLRKSEFARNLAKLAGGTGIAHVITVLASPVLTRLFGPELFGVLTVYMSLMFLALPLSAGRYQVALPLAEDDSAAMNVLVLSISLLTASCVAVLVFITFFGDWLVSTLSMQPLRPYLWLLPLSILAGGLYDVFTYWATRTKAFTRTFTTRIVQSATQAAGQISAGLAGLGAFGLVGGHVFGRLIGAGTFAVRTYAEERSKLPLVTLQGMKRVAVRYRRFPLIYAPSTLINAANLQLIPVIITILYGSAPAGFFGLATRAVFLPLSVVGGAVAQVFFNRAAELYRRDPQRLPRFVFNVTSRLALGSTAFAALLVIAAPALFRVIFGAKWEEAGRFAQILAFPQMLQFVYSPVSQLFNVFERQRAHFLWSASLVTMSLTALVVGSMYGTVQTSLILLACSNSLLYGAALVLFHRWLRPLRNAPPAAPAA